MTDIAEKPAKAARKPRKKAAPKAAGDNTAPKAAKKKLPPQLAENVWKPGQSGNPAGRPKGSRSKFAETFLADFLKDWEEHGATAIAVLRVKDVASYVKVGASLLPKDVNVNVRPFEEMDDDQLRNHAARLVKDLGPLAAFASGRGSGRTGDEEERKSLN